MHNSHDGTHGAPAQQNRKATADGTPPRPAEAPRFHIPLVVEVRATELVEIEERDDEGACWLFQLREEILVLAGQDYYETTKFPNDDFSLVEVRREDDLINAQFSIPIR